MIIVGIDPGISGAISLFHGGKLVKVQDFPLIEVKVGKGFRKQMVAAALADMLAGTFPEGGQPGHVYLEHVNARGKEGAVGAFSFGRGFGMLEMACAALQIPYTLVLPGVWKKAMAVPADKGLARMRACREFPAFAAQFARVKDDGRAEACLIGLYGVGVSKC
jgi:crossover junction endodeoxyribonuclease RuvC